MVYFLATKSKEKVKSGPYRFRHKSGEYVYIQSVFAVFENPFNNKIEYVILRTRLVQNQPEQVNPSSYNSEQSSFSPLLLTTEEFNMLHSSTSLDNISNGSTPFEIFMNYNSKSN